jgi:hypothetical protein
MIDSNFIVTDVWWHVLLIVRNMMKKKRKRKMTVHVKRKKRTGLEEDLS